MQYQDNDYITDSDTAPWTATPSTETVPTTTPPSVQMMPFPTNTPIVASNPPTQNMPEIMALGSLIQSVQQTQTRQIYVLHQIDSRLTRLEDQARYAPVAASNAGFERASWWAMWGLLMLILGGALTIVIMLILLNVEFR